MHSRQRRGRPLPQISWIKGKPGADLSGGAATKWRRDNCAAAVHCTLECTALQFASHFLSSMGSVTGMSTSSIECIMDLPHTRLITLAQLSCTRQQGIRGGAGKTTEAEYFSLPSMLGGWVGAGQPWLLRRASRQQRIQWHQWPADPTCIAGAGPPTLPPAHPPMGVMGPGGHPPRRHCRCLPPGDGRRRRCTAPAAWACPR